MLRDEERPSSDRPGSAAGADSRWFARCADFAAVWQQVLAEAAGAPPTRIAQIYRDGAARLGVLLARAPATALESGGWLDVLLRAAVAGWPAAAGDAGVAGVRALAALQDALAQFAVLECDVLLRGCARFAEQLAHAPHAPPSFTGHLKLWIAALDEAHASAQRDGDYVHRHAAVINALVRLAATLNTAAGDACRWLNLPTREEVDRLHARIAELETQLSAHARPASPPRAAKTKAGTRGARAPGRPNPAKTLQAVNTTRRARAPRSR